MNAVDTNVLIYAHDTRESRKSAIANRLIYNLADGVLLWQVGCEYIAASRKLEPLGYSTEDAWAELRRLRNSGNRLVRRTGCGIVLICYFSATASPSGTRCWWRRAWKAA